MNLKVIIIVFFTLFCFNFQSQKLKLADLITLCSKKTWNEANTLINTKGWEYFNSKEGDLDTYNEVTWSYQRNYYNDKASGWLTLFTFEGLPSKVLYEVFNKESFQLIETSISSNGFKQLSSNILDDNVTVQYANDKYTLAISYLKIEPDDYYESTTTSYSIVITKKGSVFDQYNGLKYYYDDNLNLESEYYLKNGLLHGQMIEYYTNGLKKTVSNWSNGEQNGKTTNYDSLGRISTEYFIYNEMLNGIRKEYEDGILVREVNVKNNLDEGLEKTFHLNGKLRSCVILSAGKRNGVYNEYDNNGLLVNTETYSNGFLNGPFETILYDDNAIPNEKESGIYVQDKLQGKVIARTLKDNDTLRIAFYSNGLKTGKWQVFENNKLAFEYNFKNDKLDGDYKQYFTSGENTGKLISECYYQNGLIDGIEKIYFDLYETFDETGNKSGMAYLPVQKITTYSEGKKNGHYKYVEFETLMAEGDYLDDLKTGSWRECEFGKFWDTTTILELQGKYAQDIKEGKWTGKVNNKEFLEYNYKAGKLNGPCFLYKEDASILCSLDYESDKLINVHWYRNNFNYQSFSFLNQKNSSIKIQVEYKDEYSKSRIDYRINDNINFENENFLQNFIYQTNAIDPYEFQNHNNKEGGYFFENNSTIIKGQFVNNFQTGNWTTNYKSSSVKQIQTFSGGLCVEEQFVTIDEKPFKGTLIFEQNGVQTSIKIKDGKRNGPTIIEKDGNNISLTKYKKGVVKQ